MFPLIALAHASIPEGCTAEDLPGGLRTVTCPGLAVTWGVGPEHAIRGAAALADPHLSFPTPVTARAALDLPGATAAATGVLALEGIGPRRIVVGYAADWMVTCSTPEPGLARCLDLIARTAP